MIARLIVICIGTVFLAGCAASTTDATPASTTRYSAADEALYLARFNRLAEGGSGGSGLADYDPLETVVGVANPRPFPVELAASLSPEALAIARDYAAARNSAALIVWRNGKIEEETYFGDTTRDTTLNSRSLAKPLTAIVIGRAIQEGHVVSLDQPVADFITEWKGDEQRQKILVRHLLDMRVGFLRQSFATEPESILNRAYLHPRHEDVLIHDYPLTHEPGTRYEYSNATSEMVAPLIERATGMRYAEYVSQAVLKPLAAAGGTQWINRPGGMAHSGCCIQLPARTYLSMAILLLQDGVWEGQRLLPEGYVAQMRQGTAENPYYGMGIWLPHTYVEQRGYAHPSIRAGLVFHSEPYLDKNIFLFDGNGNQVVYMIPSANMIILRIGGRPSREAGWDNAFLPNLLIRDANRAPGAKLPEPQPR